MNLAILGRTEWLYDSAHLLRHHGHTIRLVVTSREAPEYRRTVADFQRLAQECGAGFVVSPTLDSAEVSQAIARAGSLDIAVSMNVPHVVSQPAIDRFRLGILNAHGGDLPRYRGNACQAWAILNGESRIGLCVHRMVGGELDRGDIVARAYRALAITDRIGDLLSWIGEETPQLFVDALARLSADPGYVLERQSIDPRDALRCYPRTPEDGGIQWGRSNVDVLRLINASSEPYAGAFCRYRDKPLVVWRAQLHADDERYLAVPGQVASIDADGSVVVICGEGKLRLLDVTYDGARLAPGCVIRTTRARLT